MTEEIPLKQYMLHLFQEAKMNIYAQIMHKKL